MAEEKKQEVKVEQKVTYDFPSETVDLPSGGKIYGEDSPLYSGKIDIKYMTAKEEDILTSQNLIEKGVVIDKLLDSLVLTPGVSVDSLILGDKNAVMVAARILAYGPEYTAEVTNPKDLNKYTHTFNLTDCAFKKLDEKITKNSFEFDLPASKKKITFKILNGADEKAINKELENIKKLGSLVSPELSTRLRYSITSVDGDSDQTTINGFVNNMLARDSFALRKHMLTIAPDIDMTQEVEIGGDVVTVTIPMTATFFWPDFE